MMFDQLDVILNKVTHIDRFKGNDISGSIPGIIEVFGAGRRGLDEIKFRADWLSPFVNICFPPSVYDEVMGFCRPVPSKSSPSPVLKKTVLGTSVASDEPRAQVEMVPTSTPQQPQQRKTPRTPADLV